MNFAVAHKAKGKVGLGGIRRKEPGQQGLTAVEGVVLITGPGGEVWRRL